MADVIQIRRDTAENWTRANPILAQGEFGFETDTLKLKVGDGITTWVSLRYYRSEDSYTAGDGISIQDFVVSNTGVRSLATGSANGTIKVNGTTDVSVKGLGSAAYTASNAYATAAQGTKADNAADKNLSNLTSTGKNIGNWSDNITNCIIQVPQDINLTLSDGTFTLKSGSIITAPDGTQLQIVGDKSQSSAVTGGANKVLVCCNKTNGALRFRDLVNCVSGPGATTTAGFAYDTTTNKICYYSSTGTLQYDDNTLPIAIVSAGSDGKIASIDQVFNGFGYIGSSFFYLPGIKVLSGNGFNADGTVKSTLGSITSLYVKTYTGTTTDYIAIGADRDFFGPYYEQTTQPSTNGLWYNQETNLLLRSTDHGSTWVQRKEVVVATITTGSGGVISSLSWLKNPLRLVDYSEVYTKNYVDTQLSDKANTSLSNLASAGKNITNWSNNVANCIMEVPQNIKLELSGGTLTLKAGSKVYVPDGSGSFATTTVASDITVGTPYTNAPIFLYYYNGGVQQAAANAQESGSSYTITAGYWYDTTNNYIKRITSSAVAFSGVSFPIGIVSATNGSWSNIDQIFNGFGYIGSTLFALPGVKTLRPDGRNADGTLKNVIQDTISVVTTTLSSVLPGNTTFGIGYNHKITFVGGGYYNADDNYVYDTYNPGVPQGMAICGKITNSTSSPYAITLFEPKQCPFHAVDYSDTEFIAHQAMPSDRYTVLTLGTSGTTYTAPADGYFALDKSTLNANERVGMYNPVTRVSSILWAPASGLGLRIFVPVKKGDVISVNYTATGTTNTFRFVYANGTA